MTKTSTMRDREAQRLIWSSSPNYYCNIIVVFVACLLSLSSLVTRSTDVPSCMPRRWSANAAVITRSYPGNVPWFLYDSGTVNASLANCIRPPDVGCTTGTNNGQGCKWNVLKSADLGFGLYVVLRFRYMSSYHSLSPSGASGSWLDNIFGYTIPCTHVGNGGTPTVEFEFVDLACRTVPMYDATVHLDSVTDFEVLTIQPDGGGITKSWSRQTGGLTLTSTTARPGSSGAGSLLVDGLFGSLRLAITGGGDYVRLSAGVNLFTPKPQGVVQPAVGNILDFRRGRLVILLAIRAAEYAEGYRFIQQPDGTVSEFSFTFPSPFGSAVTPGGTPLCLYVNDSTASCRFGYNTAYMPKQGWRVDVFINNETIALTANDGKWFWEGVTNRRTLFASFNIAWDRTFTSSLSVGTLTTTHSLTTSLSLTTSVTATVSGSVPSPSSSPSATATMTETVSSTRSESPSVGSPSASISSSASSTDSITIGSPTAFDSVSRSHSLSFSTSVSSTVSPTAGTLSAGSSNSNSHPKSPTKTLTSTDAPTMGSLTATASSTVVGTRSVTHTTTLSKSDSVSFTTTATVSISQTATLSPLSPTQTKSSSDGLVGEDTLTHGASSSLPASWTKTLTRSVTRTKGSVSSTATTTVTLTQTQTASATPSKSKNTASVSTSASERKTRGTASGTATMTTTLSVSMTRSATASVSRRSPTATASFTAKSTDSATIRTSETVTTTMSLSSSRSAPMTKDTRSAVASESVSDQASRTVTTTLSVTDSVIPVVVVPAPVLIRAVLSVARTRLVLVFKGVTQNHLDDERWLCKRAKEEFVLYSSSSPQNSTLPQTINGTAQPTLGQFGLCGGLWWSTDPLPQPPNASSGAQQSAPAAQSLSYFVILLSGDARLVPRNLRIGPSVENNVTGLRRAGGAPSPSSSSSAGEGRGFAAQDAIPPVYYVYERLSPLDIVPIEVDVDPSRMPRVESEMGVGWAASASVAADSGAASVSVHGAGDKGRRGRKTWLPSWAIIVITMGCILFSLRLFLAARFFAREYRVWDRTRHAWYEWRLARMQEYA